MVDFNTCLGAHSHIRGLGLDDALQPRQVIIISRWITRIISFSGLDALKVLENTFTFAERNANHR